MLRVLNENRFPLSLVAGVVAGFYSYLRKDPRVIVTSPPRSWKGEISSPLSSHEARLVLNTSRFSTDAEVTKNYRSLLAKAHPDRGGSKYIAAIIGEAHEKLRNRC